MVTPVKSVEDKRVYRVLSLKNRLQAIVVSDEEADKAAACLNVGVGAMSDPRSGTAHFLEHMLHLGTKKYPDEQAYKKFLREHGGSSNAATGPEYTFYYFDIKSQHLDDALDRFSQLFTAPLFTESATEREMNAVQNEYMSGLQIDSRRAYYLHKSLVNKGHPFDGFFCGNLETLKTISRDELIKFHREHYASSLMKLAVVGREPVDELERIVRERFSDIPDREDAHAPKFAEFPFSNTVGSVVRVVPVRDHRTIEVCWPVPTLYNHWRTKITSGISHCIGHEGPGSLLSYLKSKGWANALGVSARHSNYTFMALMSTHITLTPEGLENWEKVLESIYAYLNVLRGCSDEEWTRIYEEQSKLSAIDFRFAAKPNARSTATSLSSRLRQYGAEHVLDGPYLYDHYDISKTKEYLSMLTPDNMFIYLTSKEFESVADKTEKWYDVKHSTGSIDPELAKRCAAPEAVAALKLPEENKFIASNFDLISRKEPAAAAGAESKEDASPKLLESVGLPESMLSWHKLDRTFERPKAIIRTKLHIAEASASPRASTLSSLLMMLLNDALDESTYDAALAGIHFSVSSFYGGFTVSCSGYNEKLPVLVQHVLDALVAFPKGVSKDRFPALQESYVRNLKNARICRPVDESRKAESRFLSSSVHAPHQKLPHAVSATWDDVVEHAAAVFGRARIGAQTFIHGNIDRDEAIAISKSISKTLSLSDPNRALPPSAWPLKQAFKIPFYPTLSPLPLVGARKPGDEAASADATNAEASAGADADTAPSTDIAKNITEERKALNFYAQSTNKTEKNSALCNYYEINLNSLDLRCKALVFAHIAKLPIFNELRTQQQLAYIVWSLPTVNHAVLGFEVIIQSSNRTPDQLDSRVEEYLATLRGELTSMTDEKLKEFKDAVLTIRTEKPKNLGSEFNKHWAEISSRRYDFSVLDGEVERIERVTKDEVIDFYDRYVAPTGDKRRKLSVKVYGHADETRCTNEELRSELSRFTDADHATPSADNVEVGCLEGVLYEGNFESGTKLSVDEFRRGLELHAPLCEAKPYSASRQSSL